jgi:hypothetical protein
MNTLRYFLFQVISHRSFEEASYMLIMHQPERVNTDTIQKYTTFIPVKTGPAAQGKNQYILNFHTHNGEFKVTFNIPPQIFIFKGQG